MRACAGSGARRAYLAQVPRAACVSYVLMRAMHAIRGAAERADSTDAARLPAVLHTLKRQGVTGAIAFGGEGNLRDPAFTIYRAGGRTWAVAGVLGGVGASGNAAACVAAGVSGSSGAVRPPGLPGFAKVANASKDASKWQPVQEADR
ncbi:hypothetical protein AM256_23015 [Burkholderia pseudomallei]|nr:hypothetical protein AM256_23015 [Burkholderia pseudomallei]ALC02558.1 hypothetical protein AM257_23045 [Burkholderia pseudomallei]